MECGDASPFSRGVTHCANMRTDQPAGPEKAPSCRRTPKDEVRHLDGPRSERFGSYFQFRAHESSSRIKGEEFAESYTLRLSEEEKLAADALQKIHLWLEKEAGGGSFIPRLALKFCGGCNPVFERGEVAQRIREGFRAPRWVSWEEESDLVLIINGCPTACAERAEVQKHSKASLVIQPGGVSDIEKMRSA